MLSKELKQDISERMNIDFDDMFALIEMQTGTSER
mgnify:CR=1 FL=1